MKEKIIFIIITILIIIGIFYSGYKMNEISQKTSKEYSIPESKPRSYVIFNIYSDNEQIISIKNLLAFDENNKLADSRLIWEFANEKIAQENYDNWKKAELK